MIKITIEATEENDFKSLFYNNENREIKIKDLLKCFHPNRSLHATEWSEDVERRGVTYQPDFGRPIFLTPDIVKTTIVFKG